MKKLIVSVFAIVTIAICPSAVGQNNVWSLPPNYYNHNTDTYDSLPIPDLDPLGDPNTSNNPYDGYDGQESEICHNAMQDAQGNLLFFIVDGLIYDKHGYFIDEFYDGGTDIKGTAEIVIIPDPVNCQKYYIILAGRAAYTGFNNKLPYFGVLDLSLPSEYYYPEPLGALERDSSTYTATSIAAITPNFVFLGSKQGACFIAASKIRSDNSRFVFISNGRYAYRYKIDSNGFNYDNYYLDFVLPPYGAGTAMRGEMELVELSNGNYRIATPYIYEIYNYPNIEIGHAIFTAELTDSATLVSGTDTSLIYNYTGNDVIRPYFHGLEFSPDGNILYITHDSSSLHPYPIEYFDFNNTSSGVQALNVTNAMDFKSSQIELSKDGSLYFATNNRLATLSSPNSPNTTNWNNNAQSISYSPNYEGTSTTDYNLKSYLLPDQIDGMDYHTHFFATPECCVAFSAFTTGTENENHVQSGTQSWTTSSNPFGNADTITVRDELIIQSGANITATSLRFEFAPKAKLTIEEGAIFTISGCTLTVNTECDTNAMWIGVEVLGVDSGQQTGSGKLIANSSLIEHAYIATHNYKTIAGSTTEDYGYRGGIIQASGTTFRNNHRATVFFDYQNINGSGNPIDDLSEFTNCIFITDGQLNQDTLTPTVIMAHLFGVQGVNFYGSDFKNTASYYEIPYIDRGLGIATDNCLLTVTRKCNDIYCTTPDRGNFTDLLRGIESVSTSARTTEVSYTNFTNNWRGIYLETVDLATVIENSINVGADSYWGSSYGLYLDNCDGYTVENNTFTTNNTTQNGYVGVYVLNSGTENNEIYRNTFDKFYIGSQADDTNGDYQSRGNPNGKGLEFRCNTYTNGRDHDILISSGMVKPIQGTCTNATTPVNNRFSYTTQYGDFWQPDSIPDVTYRFSQPNGYNLTPRSYPTNPTHYNDSNTFPSLCSSTFYPNTSCPDRINTGGGSESFSSEGGSSDGLIEELEGYKVILEELNAEMNKLDQNDTSATLELRISIAYYENEVNRTKNNILRYFLFSNDVEERFNDAIAFLEQENFDGDKQRLVGFYIANKSYNKAQEILDELSKNNNDTTFSQLYYYIIQLEQSGNKVEELITNTALIADVTEIADASIRKKETAIAEVLMKRAKLRNYQEQIEMLNISSHARLMNQNGETSNLKLQTSNAVTVYPNPTSNEVNITHNLNLENGKVTFKVYNMLGVEVLNENLTSTNNEVQLTNLKAGVYFYTVTQNNQAVKTDKLMVK